MKGFASRFRIAKWTLSPSFRAANLFTEYVSRARRSTKWCAADPGSSETQSGYRDELAKTPDQRCTANALHRIRGRQHCLFH
jgi:hypothetical protein